MTLTATRETGTVRPTSSPTLRFLGGVGVMLLAITIGAWIISYIIAMLQVGPYPPWELPDKNIGFDAAFKGCIAGNILGLAGLAWFSLRRSDWMPFLGGFTVVALELALILTLLFI
jgi:hypothetical protein